MAPRSRHRTSFTDSTPGPGASRHTAHAHGRLPRAMSERKRMTCALCGQGDVAHYLVKGAWIPHVKHQHSALHIAAQQASVDAAELRALKKIAPTIQESLMSRLDGDCDDDE